MGATWYRVRADLRAHRRSALALVLLVGCIGAGRVRPAVALRSE